MKTDGDEILVHYCLPLERDPTLFVELCRGFWTKASFLLAKVPRPQHIYTGNEEVVKFRATYF